MRKLSIIASLLILIAGCGTFQTNEAAWRLGVTYAIQRYVYEKPADAQEATKARICSIAGDLKALASGDAVTLPLLRQALAVQLDKAELIPPDRALLEGVADIVVAELGKRIGDGIIPADQVFEVVAVLELVERAAA
jgi:hypothetical protein